MSTPQLRDFASSTLIPHQFSMDFSTEPAKNQASILSIDTFF
jgi:hypothetical protein